MHPVRPGSDERIRDPVDQNGDSDRQPHQCRLDTNDLLVIEKQ
jgi:hypothetical protein